MYIYVKVLYLQIGERSCVHGDLLTHQFYQEQSGAFWQTPLFLIHLLI